MLTWIDEVTLDQHFYLDAANECCFLREYTSRVGYKFSESNNLILNFKKEIKHKNKMGWHYKLDAIEQLASEMRSSLLDEFLQRATLVPIPPSKAKTDPEYDDRMFKFLNLLSPDAPADVRELIIQPETTKSVHRSENRLNPSEIYNSYQIDESVSNPTPRTIGIFDDVVTTGAHYVAARRLLKERFPGVKIYGIFISRRVFADQNPEKTQP